MKIYAVERKPGPDDEWSFLIAYDDPEEAIRSAFESNLDDPASLHRIAPYVRLEGENND